MTRSGHWWDSHSLWYMPLPLVLSKVLQRQLATAVHPRPSVLAASNTTQCEGANGMAFVHAG